MQLDLTHLEQLFKGNRARIEEWIRLYLQESPAYFELLRTAQKQGDAEALASAAHDLQPQAHYLGSVRMRDLLANIEARASTQGTVTCEDLLSELFTARAIIDGELHVFLGDERNR